jgi:hypothetical protein
VWWADLGQRGEDVELQLGDLRDGLDDEVDVGKLLDQVCRSKASPCFIGLLLGDSGFGDIFGEELA